MRKIFGTLQALGGVDVTVRSGTFHGLIGPNGSGKSTLLKAIAGAHFCRVRHDRLRRARHHERHRRTSARARA